MCWTFTHCYSYFLSFVLFFSFLFLFLFYTSIHLLFRWRIGKHWCFMHTWHSWHLLVPTKMKTTAKKLFWLDRYINVLTDLSCSLSSFCFVSDLQRSALKHTVVVLMTMWQYMMVTACHHHWLADTVAQQHRMWWNHPATKCWWTLSLTALWLVMALLLGTGPLMVSEVKMTTQTNTHRDTHSKVQWNPPLTLPWNWI